MVELDLKYCPECADEYRAEIEKCADCGIELITGQQKIERDEARRKKLESRVSDLSPDDELVTIRKGTLPEMQHLTNLLNNEKIGSILLGDMKSCSTDRFGNTNNCPTSYDLQVKREDGLEALQIIEEDHKKTTDLERFDRSNIDSIYNPQASEARCPACGHVFPTSEKACPECGLNFG